MISYLSNSWAAGVLAKGSKTQNGYPVLLPSLFRGGCLHCALRANSHWWWWWWYGSCCSHNLKAKAITRHWDNSQYAPL